MAPGPPHLIQGVVSGIAERVSGAGPSLEGEHLLLLLVQQGLYILNHDRVVDAMGLQEDFNGLDAGERHSDIDGGARLGRTPPEVQLVGGQELALSQRAGKGQPGGRACGLPNLPCNWAWGMDVGAETKGNPGHWTKSIVVKEMAQEAE